jgi:hypothetical protein
MSDTFPLRRIRCREIARLVAYRHGEWPDTDDANIYLVAVAYHLPRNDLCWHVGNWLYSKFGVAYADTVLDAVARDVIHSPRQRLRADDIGKMLRVTYAERQQLKLHTIGCHDVSRRGRTLLRKRRRRDRERERRRRKGAVPRSQSLSRSQPWIAEGISRRTWYRRRKSPVGTVGTNTWPHLLPSHAHATVPTSRRSHMPLSSSSPAQ